MGRTIAAIASAGISQTAIVANEPDAYRPFGVPVILDRRPGVGPLGGIEAALLHYRAERDGVLILPCDLPGITADEVSALCAEFAGSIALEEPHEMPAVVVAETGEGFWQALCAVVPTRALSPVTIALDRGRRSVYRLWRELRAVPVHFADEAPFFNVNTIDDFEGWLVGSLGPVHAGVRPSTAHGRVRQGRTTLSEDRS